MPNWKVGEKTDLKYWREKRSMERQRERHMAAAAVKLIDQKRRIYGAVVSSWAWDSGAEDERAWCIWIRACLFVLGLVSLDRLVDLQVYSFIFLSCFCQPTVNGSFPRAFAVFALYCVNPTTCSQRNASNYTLSFIPKAISNHTNKNQNSKRTSWWAKEI